MRENGGLGGYGVDQSNRGFELGRRQASVIKKSFGLRASTRARHNQMVSDAMRNKLSIRNGIIDQKNKEKRVNS